MVAHDGLIELAPDVALDEDDWVDVSIAGGAFSGEDLEGFRMTNANLVDCDLSGATLYDVERKSLVEIYDEFQEKVESVRKRKDPALEKTRGMFLSIPYFLLNFVLKTISFFSYTLNLDLRSLAGTAGLKVACRQPDLWRVIIDGVDTGRTCPVNERIPVQPGPHRLTLYAPNGDRTIERVANVRDRGASTRLIIRE